MTLYRLTHREDPFNTYLYAGANPRQALANMFVDWQKANPDLHYPVKPEDWEIEEDAQPAPEPSPKRLEDMSTKELAGLYSEVDTLQKYIRLLIVRSATGNDIDTKRLAKLRVNLPKEFLR